MWARIKGISIKDLDKNKSDFEKYRSKVFKATDNQAVKLLENFNKRGKAGKDGAYHLDHTYSIFKGFKKQYTSKTNSTYK
jgi:hypothetical protein